MTDSDISRYWRKIEKALEKWKWRVLCALYIFATVVFYIWIEHGTDAPEAERFFLWIAPLLVAFALKTLVDTHLAVAGFVEPDVVNSKECDHRLFDRLRKIARRKHTVGKPICIDVLGVALHHSHLWIDDDLKTFMNEFPSVVIELRIAFVAPDTLSAFAFYNRPIDWAAESRERLKWVKEKLYPFAMESGGHLRVHVRLIKNLPHWHGVMVERRYLFLGRVSWTDGTERFHQKPTRLTCAENGYRVFSVDDHHHGDERVSLFRRWIAHYLYGNHDGEVLLDTLSSFYDTVPSTYPKNDL